jgi:hypothetical protein
MQLTRIRFRGFVLAAGLVMGAFVLLVRYTGTPVSFTRSPLALNATAQPGQENQCTIPTNQKSYGDDVLFVGCGGFF